MVTCAAPRSSRGASGTLGYMTEGKAHDGTDKPRAWHVDGFGCMPETAKQEWAGVRQQFGKDDGQHVQAVHLVLSFDRSEYDPDDPAARARAQEQAVEFADRVRGGHQAVVALQTDGKAGLCHAHIAINAVHPETGRSLNGRHPAKDVNRQRAICNEVAREYGFDNERLMEERASKRITCAEQAVHDKGAYSWKHDFHERMDAAISGSTDRDELKAAAAERDIEIKYRGKNGVSYKFTDPDGAEHKVRGREAGSAWQAKGLDVQLEANRTIQLEKERLEREEQDRLTAERAEKEQADRDAWDFEVPDRPQTAQQVEKDGWDFEVPAEKGKTRSRAWGFEVTGKKSHDYGMEL